MLHANGISGPGWARQYLSRIFAVFALCTGIGAMAADDTTKAGEQDPSLREIVVTATRRAENIQDVPLSITAVTADDIAQRNFVSEEDYLRTIPGVNQVDEVGSSAIVIRGVETSPSFQNYASGPTVATYFGETSTTASAGLTAEATSTSSWLILIALKYCEGHKERRLVVLPWEERYESFPQHLSWTTLAAKWRETIQERPAMAATTACSRAS